MSFVNICEKIDRVITALHCTWNRHLVAHHVLLTFLLWLSSSLPVAAIILVLCWDSSICLDFLSLTPKRTINLISLSQFSVWTLYLCKVLWPALSPYTIINPMLLTYFWFLLLSGVGVCIRVFCIFRPRLSAQLVSVHVTRLLTLTLPVFRSGDAGNAVSSDVAITTGRYGYNVPVHGCRNTV